MMNHLLDALHDPQPSIEPIIEAPAVPCERCSGTGWIEYEIDPFGRKTEWGRCNARGCCGGEIEVEAMEVAAA